MRSDLLRSASTTASRKMRNRGLWRRSGWTPKEGCKFEDTDCDGAGE